MLIKKAAVLNQPTGSQTAVIADFTEPFIYVNPQGEQRTSCIMAYQLASTHLSEAGTAVRNVVTEFVTPSLHPKSKLRQRLEGLIGKKIADAEMPDNFDTQTLIGKSCQVNLILDESGYSRVQSISALPAGTAPIAIQAYVRPQWVLDQISKGGKAPVDPSSSPAGGSREPQRLDLNDVLKRI